MKSNHAVALACLRDKSKSFAMAQHLLPAQARRPAAALYAWCRRADDAVDELPPDKAAQALARLEAELDSIYAGAGQSDPVLQVFQQAVSAAQIPKTYPRELLLGMRMDLAGIVYETLEDLHQYCYRVAGTVGLMMCHVLGVSHPRALKHAAHLGMAMQLTNICRDVVEDWQRQRLYLPRALLPIEIRHLEPEGTFPPELVCAVAQVVERLLREADRFYASGDRGLRYLAPRSAWAIRLARLLYSRIGRVLARRRYDVTLGRAQVATAHKLWLVLRALAERITAWPRRFDSARHNGSLPALRYPSDVLPL